VGYVACLGENRKGYRVLLGEIDGKKVLGRPRHKWDYIKMEHKEMGWGGTDSMALAQDRYRWQELVNAVIDFRIP
jgi:hypothetical protein